MTKEEAENKCALNCLAVMYKSKFTTYYDLQNYFRKKKGKYLDIILLDKESKKEEEYFKMKKIDEYQEIIDLTIIKINNRNYI